VCACVAQCGVVWYARARVRACARARFVPSAQPEPHLWWSCCVAREAWLAHALLTARSAGAGIAAHAPPPLQASPCRVTARTAAAEAAGAAGEGARGDAAHLRERPQPRDLDDAGAAQRRACARGLEALPPAAQAAGAARGAAAAQPRESCGAGPMRGLRRHGCVLPVPLCRRTCGCACECACGWVS
jgi:hypothetical protein